MIFYDKICQMVWQTGEYITTMIPKVPEGVTNAIDELHDTLLLIIERGDSGAVIHGSVTEKIASCSLKRAGIDTFDYH
jgi:hypothetical protein